MTVPSEKRLLLAAWVAPMNGPVLRGGGVVIAAGRIVAVGDGTALRRTHADAMVEDLGNLILLPGLVNAHAHLELSDCSEIEPLGNATFADWIMQLRPRLRVGERTIEEAAKAGVEVGVAQCLRFGVTTVGDISQQHRVTRPLLCDGPLRVVSYGEALGLGAARARFERLLLSACDESFASERLRVAISPHAPYTVDLAGYRQCLQRAEEGNLPLATHLAETMEETDFLTEQSGPFRAIWEKLGAWTDDVETYRGPPIRFAQSIGLLDRPTLLAHVNYCDDGELGLLGRGRASVVYCPRTHAYFGHPPHRWRDMLAAGVNVALGTDSCASSPDLNLVDDLRHVHRIAPDVPADDLWKLITINGARSVEMADIVGSLEPGKAGDLVAFAAVGHDPLREILESARLPEAVWIGGERVTFDSRARSALPG